MIFCHREAESGYGVPGDRCREAIDVTRADVGVLASGYGEAGALPLYADARLPASQPASQPDLVA